MSVAAHEGASLEGSAAPSRREFVLKRLHSLTGVVPLGGFLFEHLYTNAAATSGRASFERAVEGLQALPGLWGLELFGIALPLAFHGLYGVALALRGGANAYRYAYARNWLYLLQRASGFVTLAFVLLHLWHYRVAKALGTLAVGDFYDRLHRDMNVPWLFGAYVLGVSASVFHLANGLHTAGNTWGLAVSARAVKRSAWLCGAFGVGLWVLGVNTLLHFGLRCGGLLAGAAARAAACPGLP